METIINKEKKRFLSLDIIRVFVIFNVVWGHCLEYVNYNSPIASLMYAIDKTSAPLFLMLTGALMIPREFELKEFFKNKLFYIYLISVFWFFIYGVINLPHDSNLLHESHALRPLEHDMWFLSAIHNALILRPTAEHLWYLSTIVLIYFLLPWLSGIKSYSNKSILVLISGCFIYKWLDMFFGFGHTVGSYIVYIMYLIYGYLIFNRKLYEKISLKLLLPLFIITLVLFQYVIRFDFYFKAFHGLDPWWIYSPFIVLFSLQLYVLLLNSYKYIDKFVLKYQKIIQELSKNIFGVYIIHYMILLKLLAFIPNIYLLYFITLVLSFILVWSLSKIPLIKYLFFKK